MHLPSLLLISYQQYIHLENGFDYLEIKISAGWGIGIDFFFLKPARCLHFYHDYISLHVFINVVLTLRLGRPIVAFKVAAMASRQI
jgi:hypothetical protein